MGFFAVFYFITARAQKHHFVGSVQERTICNFFSKMSYHLERAVHITIYQEKNTDHEIS